MRLPVVAATTPFWGAAGSGYKQAEAKLGCVESDDVAVAFGPPA